MGIRSIKCDGLYAESGKTGFGEGFRSASDFDGGDLIALAPVLAVPVAIGGMGILIATGHVKMYMTNEEADADRPPYHMGTGTITREYNRSGGYELLATKQDFMLDENGHKLSIVSLKNADAINFCTFTDKSMATIVEDPAMYTLTCLHSTKEDSIESGDRVAIYGGHEVK